MSMTQKAVKALFTNRNNTLPFFNIEIKDRFGYTKIKELAHGYSGQENSDFQGSSL